MALRTVLLVLLQIPLSAVFAKKDMPLPITPANPSKDVHPVQRAAKGVKILISVSNAKMDILWREAKERNWEYAPNVQKKKAVNDA